MDVSTFKRYLVHTVPLIVCPIAVFLRTAFGNISKHFLILFVYFDVFCLLDKM